MHNPWKYFEIHYFETTFLEIKNHAIKTAEIVVVVELFFPNFKFEAVFEAV